MSRLSIISGCGLCKFVQYMGARLGEVRCIHDQHPATTAAMARMKSGHCGPDRASFKPFMGQIPAKHTVPVKGEDA